MSQRLGQEHKGWKEVGFSLAIAEVKRLVENFFTGCLSWDDGYLMCTNHLLLGICVFTFAHEKCWTDHI